MAGGNRNVLLAAAHIADRIGINPAARLETPQQTSLLRVQREDVAQHVGVVDATPDGRGRAVDRTARRSISPPNPEEIHAGTFAALRNKFFVDELYEATVVRFNATFARFCHWLDSVVLDTLVIIVSCFVLGLSWLNRVIDEYVVNLGFDEVCQRLRRGGGLLSRLQDGQVQNYLSVIGMALTVLLLLLTWGCGK